MTDAEFLAMTDAEVLAWASELTLDVFKRTLQAKLEGADEAEAMATARAGMADGFERVAAVDLRELGYIKELPRLFRHWVYRHRKDPEKVYIIGWKHRLRLQEVGYTEMSVFVKHDGDSN